MVGGSGAQMNVMAPHNLCHWLYCMRGETEMRLLGSLVTRLIDVSGHKDQCRKLARIAFGC